uniref:HTH_38 domain-containing protein n=1 Tax=Heterorhabditis bacteriophora TaxID=37862 RepID=A0A1I7WR88_HETBA
MGHAPKLGQHERGQIKALSTTGCTVKQIADVVKRCRKAVSNSLLLQEYGTSKSSGRLAKLSGREKDPFNTGKMSEYRPITDEEVSRTGTNKQGRKTSYCQIFLEM